jgi:hypothetical protein
VTLHSNAPVGAGRNTALLNFKVAHCSKSLAVSSDESVNYFRWFVAMQTSGDLEKWDAAR